jgi:hypothetical protein
MLVKVFWFIIVTQSSFLERKDKLKEAQEEAKTEVDVFKSQKLAEFTKFKEEVLCNI